jgi:two-component system, response regulator FlrC
MQRALVLCEGDLIRSTHIVFEPAAAEPAAAAEPHEPRPPSPARAPSSPGTEAVGTCLPPPGGSAALAAQALAVSLASVERELILQALRTQSGRSQAAAQLGISPRTLRYKLARLRAAGVAVDDAAADAPPGSDP